MPAPAGHAGFHHKSCRQRALYHVRALAAFDNGSAGLWQNVGLIAHSAMPMSACRELFLLSQPACGPRIDARG